MPPAAPTLWTFKIIELQTMSYQLANNHKPKYRASHPNLYKVQLSGLQAKPGPVKELFLVSARKYQRDMTYTLDGYFPTTLNPNLQNGPSFFVDNTDQPGAAPEPVLHGVAHPTLRLSGNFNLVAVTFSQRHHARNMTITEGTIGKLDANLKKQLAAAALPLAFQEFFAEGRPITIYSRAAPTVGKAATATFNELRRIQLAGRNVLADDADPLQVVQIVATARRQP